MSCEVRLEGGQVGEGETSTEPGRAIEGGIIHTSEAPLPLW